MKRVILSRKGFDSKYGGRPSPIFKNDDIFSLPIPQNGKSPKKYHELKFNGINGTQALKEVSATHVTSEDFCHYDPALNDKIGLFGQAGSAQSELKNNDVGIGDLFLFFGWFKKTENPIIDIHKIFGWLQIEEILEVDKQISNFLKKHYLSHPHDPKYILSFLFLVLGVGFAVYGVIPRDMVKLQGTVINTFVNGKELYKTKRS